MKAIALVLCVLIAVLQPWSAEAVSGSVGLEGGVVGGILVALVPVVALALGLGVCLYRNDMCPAFVRGNGYSPAPA